MYTTQGQQYQAMKISASQLVTGVLQSEMFWNSNCDPVQWTDQLNDTGASITVAAISVTSTTSFTVRITPMCLLCGRLATKLRAA